MPEFVEQTRACVYVTSRACNGSTRGVGVLLILHKRLHEMLYPVLVVLVLRSDDRDGRLLGLVVDFQDARSVRRHHHVVD